MSEQEKQLSNPFSTGGGGGHFEAHIQSSFIALMLSGGYCPCLPSWPIKEVKLQGKVDGYDTDDLIVFVESPQSDEVRKLLGQVKHSVAFTKANNTLAEVITAAWYDFNNTSIFTPNKDVIALITGPISAIDQQNVQWLLHHAKHTKNADEYYRHVEQAKFSPSKAEEKLDVFKHHLSIANNGQEVTDEELYEFLNNFHVLGYDVGGETGVVLPLLHSHISQFNNQYPKMVWSRIVDVVQTWNQHAGTITRDKLPDDLLEPFSVQVPAMDMPEEFNQVIVPETADWSQEPDIEKLAIMVFVGAWNENNENDRAILSDLLNMQYVDWLPIAQRFLHKPDSYLKLKNGVWTVTSKVELLSAIGSHVLDVYIENFKSVAVRVLSEADPAFELPKNERYAASIHGKVLSHSTIMRQGISEGLALLGTQSESLINSSASKPEAAAHLAVRELLDGAGWVIWGTLSSLLPNLAEAAPSEFLNQVEKALGVEPCPFDEIFSQEGDSIMGRNYHAGLLWALEGLAWEDQYLVRVCSILGLLAVHDSGGTWANRPDNSIKTILLPWLPQTLASADKHLVAIKAILKDAPEIGWKVLIQLLPGQLRTSSGTHKPKWRKSIPEDWEKGVTNQEYWDQASKYADLVVDIAGKDYERLGALIEHLDHLPVHAFNQFLSNLESSELKELPEKHKRVIWDKLTKLLAKHRRFSESKWALPNDALECIEKVAENFTPTDSFQLYHHLFSNRDMDLYEERGNWEEQRNKLDEKRQNAIQKLFEEQTLERVIQFAQSVESAHAVGLALGSISDDTIDKQLLPNLLTSEDHKLINFIGAYIWRRCYVNGWGWVDSMPRSEWTSEQLGQLLAYLPFEKKAWERAVAWLGEDESEYWKRTSANAYHTEDDLFEAIENLIEHGRPRAAIECLAKLQFDQKPLNSEQTIKALLAGVDSGEPAHTLDQYHITELIKYLQSDETADQKGLFRVEWAYLRLLDGHNEVRPKSLEIKLASDPDFFCELIQLIFRSRKEDHTQEEPTEEQKAIAGNAWELLHNWHTPPGTLPNGEFSSELFNTWLERVTEVCSDSGHLVVAMINLGEVLIHAPADESGLWIHHTVAAALNARDGSDIRSGYSTGIYNSRGVHTVNPSGAPEKELAAKYRDRAESVENQGFHRFAVTLRELADDYERQANRIIDQYKPEQE